MLGWLITWSVQWMNADSLSFLILYLLCLLCPIGSCIIYTIPYASGISERYSSPTLQSNFPNVVYIFRWLEEVVGISDVELVGGG